MTVKRRYLPIRDYPVYSNEHTRLRMLSKVLNTDYIPSVTSIFWDKPNIEFQLQLIVGDSEGLYFDDDRIQRLAKLPEVRQQLKEINEEFARHCRSQVNLGYEKPKEMPDYLIERKYKLEAREDILLEEVELLSQWLKSYTDKTQREDDNKVLQYGLRCAGRLWGTHAKDPDLIDVLKSIDGQEVRMHPKGFLIIEDARSPYNGMKVSDYHKLAKIWHQERMHADDQLLLKMQAEAKANGEPKPYTTGRNMNCHIKRSDLPKWPSFARKYSLEADDTEEKVVTTKQSKLKHSK